MAVFKRIADPKSDPDTYAFDTNPDPTVFVEVDAPASGRATKSTKVDETANEENV